MTRVHVLSIVRHGCDTVIPRSAQLPQQAVRRTILAGLVAILTLACSTWSARALAQGNLLSEEEVRWARLTERLAHDGEQARLLNLARAEIAGGRSDAAIASLRQLLAAPADTFLLLPESTARSLRREAMQLLLTASPRFRTAWRTALEPMARRQLRESLQRRDFAMLRRTAAMFPLTDSGFLAHVMSVTHLLQRGDRTLGLAVADEFSQLYLQSRFREPAQDSLLRWEALTRVLPTPADSANQRRVLDFPVARGHAGVSVTRPWPVPVWSWVEDASRAPTMLQTMLLSELSTYSVQNGSPSAATSNHASLRWGDLLIHRTPVRIVAFNRESGRMAWQLTTDSLYTTGDGDDASENRLPVSFLPTSSDKTVSFAPCGMIAADRDMLFFVDGLNIGSPATLNTLRHNRLRNLGRPFVPADALNNPPETNRNPVFGTRIVAVARGSHSDPMIAWTVGAQPDRPYELVTSPDDQLQSGGHGVTAVDSTEFDDPLDGHLFYSAPCGHQGDLFITSIADDQVWLNRLQKSDGRLIWQQPLTMVPQELLGLEQGWLSTANAASCLQVADSIICCIPDGTIISVAADRGNLNWATSVQSISPRPRMRGFMLPRTNDSDSLTFTPVVSGNRLIWSAPNSPDVYCVDLATGQPLWHVANRASGPRNTSSSVDRYCAGIIGNQVLLVGQRHGRSLDLQSGQQNWIVELVEQSGRSVMDGKHLLVPESHGGMTIVDISTGSAERVAIQFLPDNSVTPNGALSIDDRYVTVTTPGSIAQYHRADLLLQDDAGLASYQLNPLQQVQAVLLTSGRDAALDRCEELLRQRPASSVSRELTSLSAEMLLQAIGRSYFAVDEVPRSERMAQCARLWNRLILHALSDAQQARAIALMSLPGSPFQATKTDLWQSSPAVLRDSWRQPHPITGDWRVRPDLLISDLNTTQKVISEHPILPQFATTSDTQEDVILQLGRPQALQDQLRTISEWVHKGQTVQAELFAHVLLRNSAGEDHDQIRAALDGVQNLDSADHGAHPVAEDSGWPAPAASYLLEQHYVVEDRLQKIPDIHRMHSGVKLMFAGSLLLYETGNSIPGSLHALDMHNGAVTAAIDFDIRQELLARPAVVQEHPGLLIAAGDSSVTAIHCSPEGRLQQLWTRRPDGIADERSIERLGVFGADFLTWQSDTRLHCTHPLNGRDLWSRDMVCAATSTLTNSPTLFGDSEVTVVVGADMYSWTRYSTRSGRLLGSGQLGLDRTQQIVADGSRLIGVAEESASLVIHDFATDREITRPDRRPVLAGDASFQLLPSGKLVVVTRDREIVVMDPVDGRVLSRNSVATSIHHDYIHGFTAFERNGKLLVGMNTERGFGESISAAPRMGEPRCDFGRLFCIDMQSGELLWERRTEPTVFCHLRGPDVLVAWSIMITDNGIRRRQVQRDLRLQFIDLRTGHTLAEHQDKMEDTPLLCHADPQTGVITVEMRNLVVTASPSEEATTSF